MFNADDLRGAFRAIAKTMADQRAYLIELDQRNGDGDLGISMADGYKMYPIEWTKKRKG